MSEMSNDESPCQPGGNYGLCRTHPTCERVRNIINALRTALLDGQEEYARLEAERDRLRDELLLWNPLTPEEAEAALARAEAEPLSEERISEIVARATDPAERLNNSEQSQLVVAITRLREALRSVLRWCPFCKGLGTIRNESLREASDVHCPECQPARVALGEQT